MRDAYEDAVLSHVARQAGRTELMNHMAFIMAVAAVPFFSPCAWIAGSMISICAHSVLSNIEGAKLRKKFDAATVDSHSADMTELAEKIDGLGRPFLRPILAHKLKVGLIGAFALAGGVLNTGMALSAILLIRENSRTRQVNDAVRRIQNNNPR